MDNCFAKRNTLLASSLLLALTLAACGGGGGGSDTVDDDNGLSNGGSTQTTNENGQQNDGQNTGDQTGGDTTDGDTTGGGTASGDTTSGDTTSGDTTGGDTTGGDTTGGGTTDGDNQQSNGGDNNTGDIVLVSDASGGDDDSPTRTEALSLQGPFIKDATRSAGPPSVPQGLTMLLTGSDWVEFTWAPSSDDQSVEAYEIYRDNSLVFTLKGTSGDLDYRSWITTSYIDCNYTRYASCTGNQPVKGSTHNYTVVAVDNEGMKSAASEPLVVQFNSISGGGVDLSNYSTVFAEEFDGGSLDRNKWKTSLPWGPDRIINGEQQYFVNVFGNNPPAYDPFTFTGSTLQITGTNTPSDMLGQANNQPYLSGVITTADYFEMTYGYVEMSAKLASGTGLLSTFYLFNQDFDNNKPEIDIIEYIGSRPDKAYQTYHYFDSNRSRWASGENHSSPTMETVTGSDMSSGYHTYSVLWEEELMVWYIDGVEVRRLTGPRVSNEPMNIIAHLVVGSEWIGQPDGGSLPAVLEIDYIRAMQK